MADIEERIEQRIRALAEELRELIREAAHQAIDDALATTASPPASSASPRHRSKTKRSSSKKRRPRPKGTRRSSEEMQRDLDALREHIRQHSGANALEIGAALGMANRELARPIKKLIASGEIRKTGVKSHTRYYPTDSAPAASAKRRPRRNNSHRRSS